MSPEGRTCASAWHNNDKNAPQPAHATGLPLQVAANRPSRSHTLRDDAGALQALSELRVGVDEGLGPRRLVELPAEMSVCHVRIGRFMTE